MALERVRLAGGIISRVRLHRRLETLRERVHLANPTEFLFHWARQQSPSGSCSWSRGRSSGWKGCVN